MSRTVDGALTGNRRYLSRCLRNDRLGVLFWGSADTSHMERFEGTVRLAEDTVALRATLLVADARLKVSTRQHEIGDWELTGITSRLLPDGCHLEVEGEELVVGVADPHRFAEAIGPSVANPGDGSLRRPTPPPEEAAALRGIGPRSADGSSRIPLDVRAIVGGVAIVAALAAWAPLVLVTIVLVVALIGLLVGSFALMDPFLAVRLPHRLAPTHLIRGGAIGVGLALLLAVML